MEKSLLGIFFTFFYDWDDLEKYQPHLIDVLRLVFFGD